MEISGDGDSLMPDAAIYCDGSIFSEDIATDHASLRFLFGLLTFIRPRVIVEAGTYRGDFTLVAAKLAEAWAGEVYTADTIHYSELPDMPNLTYFHGDYGDMLPSVEGEIEFAFVDSGPPCLDEFDYGIRKRHYLATKKALKIGGIIAVHDTNKCSDWSYGEEIVEEAGVILRGGCGLTLWQKTS